MEDQSIHPIRELQPETTIDAGLKTRQAIQTDHVVNPHNIIPIQEKGVPNPQSTPDSSAKQLVGTPNASSNEAQVKVNKEPPPTQEVEKVRTFSKAWFKKIWSSMLGKSSTGIETKAPSNVSEETKTSGQADVASKIRYFKGKATDTEKKEMKDFFVNNRFEGAKIIRNLVYANKEKNALDLLENVVELRTRGYPHLGLEKEFNEIVSKIKTEGKFTASEKKFIHFYINYEKIPDGFGELRKLKTSNENLFNELVSGLKERSKLDEDFANLQSKESNGLALVNEIKNGNKKDPLSPEDIKIINDYFSKSSEFQGGDFDKGLDLLADLANQEKFEAIFLVLKNLNVNNATFISSDLLSRLDPEHALNVLKHAFSLELEGKQDKSSFFRSNSLATKLMKEFYFQLIAKPLEKELKTFLDTHIPQERVDLALSSSNLSEEERGRVLAENQELYKSQVVKLMDGLVHFFEAHKASIPEQVGEFNQFLDQEFKNRFDDKGEKMTNANFFLRFLNPLLIGGLSEELELSQQQKNAGASLAKPLQNLTNFLTFTDLDKELPTIKEPELQPIMSFFWTNEHVTKIDRFMTNLR